MIDWIWALGFLLLMLAILAGIVYAIVSSVVESWLQRLVLTQFNHTDRKQNERLKRLEVSAGESVQQIDP